VYSTNERTASKNHSVHPHPETGLATLYIKLTTKFFLEMQGGVKPTKTPFQNENSFRLI
jgi:hypothetical protein